MSDGPETPPPDEPREPAKAADAKKAAARRRPPPRRPADRRPRKRKKKAAPPAATPAPEREPEPVPEPEREREREPEPEPAASTGGPAPAAPPDQDEPAGISRRAALGIIGASAAAAAIGFAVVRRDSGPEPALVAPGIPTADAGGPNTGSTGGIVAVGEAYLAANPAEADRTVLLAGLGLPEDAFGDPNAQLDALAGLIHEDFTADRTTRVAGWLLSLTEARLAGLAALQARASQAADATP